MCDGLSEKGHMSSSWQAFLLDECSGKGIRSESGRTVDHYMLCSEGIVDYKNKKKSKDHRKNVNFGLGLLNPWWMTQTVRAETILLCPLWLLP